MEPAVAHRRAQAAFAAVLDDVGDDDLQRPTPCEEWSVMELITHVVDANRWVVKLAGAGRVHLPDDVHSRHAVASAAAQAVFDAEQAMTRTFDLPWGPTAGAVFAMTRANDVYTHAWDLARAIDAATDIDPELGELLLQGAWRRITPEFRSFGNFFGAEVTCDPSRPVADRLAAFLGRQV
jgi:uncharacterized protein (TIGR03086 family)